jgi:beta-phosphoglucomutase-like phosphatase (HAD superfamily)
MKRENRRIGAVIFDMDGPLLDTEPVYTAATQHVVGRYGKTFDWSIKSRMLGRPAMQSGPPLALWAATVVYRAII